MKRLISASVILLLIAVLSVGGVCYEQAVFHKAEKEMSEAKLACQNNLPLEAARHTKQAVKEWEKEQKLLMMLLSHTGLNRISDDLHYAQTLAQREDLPELESQCQLIRDELQHLSDKELPKPYNIL